MSMQRQPVLIPTKLEKGKDASYKAVERLRENLDTEGVHNIGITGPYGSGKSSVVKTLIKEDENKHHFLELSLATLDDKCRTEMGAFYRPLFQSLSQSHKTWCLFCSFGRAGTTLERCKGANQTR